MSTTSRYLSLIKFSHTIFAMPFALIGFFLGISLTGREVFTASGGLLYTPDSLLGQLEAGAAPWLVAKYLGLVILCMVFARSAAMAFNR